jgi:two-component system nitrate/nitrite response regulator NarL
MERRERSALEEEFVTRFKERNYATMKVVAVVDDEEIRRCFRDPQRTGEFNCTACFARAVEALAAIPKLRPDLVVIDIRLFDEKTAEQMGRLKQQMPGLKLSIVTAAQDNDSIKRSLIAGADAYFVKPFMPTQLLGMLKFIARSKIEFKVSPDLVGQERVSEPGFLLTKREEELMACLAAGLLYKEIAVSLGISFSAVHQRQRRIFRKLRVSNRTEAVNRWRELSPVSTSRAWSDSSTKRAAGM